MVVFSQQNNLKGFDDASNIWLEPFSALNNCRFPVEYVYADWLGWQTNTEAQREDPESLIGLSDATIEAGSRAEGLCIPQFILKKSDIEQGSVLDIKERWQPDCDVMKANDPFDINDEKKLIPIIAVEHVEDDPKYAKLRLTKERKDHRPRYKNVSYLHHTFLLPSADHPMDGRKIRRFDSQSAAWSYSLHGPVRKLQSGVFLVTRKIRQAFSNIQLPGPSQLWNGWFGAAQVAGLQLGSSRKYLTLDVIWLLLAEEIALKCPLIFKCQFCRPKSKIQRRKIDYGQHRMENILFSSRK